MTDLPDPEPVTGALVVDGGEVFLMRSPKWDGRWTVPGGHVEPGEPLVDCVAREVREETGLVVEETALLGVDEAIDPPTFERPVHFVFVNFRCTVADRDVDLDDEEATAHEWVAPRRALEYDLTEGVERMVRSYLDG